jgi:hypothetical protein
MTNHRTDNQEREALRCVEDGPVKRPYLSLVRNRTTWSDLRLADGEQYTIGERVDAVELTPEIRAALAENGDAGFPAEAHLHNALLEINSDWSDWGEAEALERVLQIAADALKGRPEHYLPVQAGNGDENDG